MSARASPLAEKLGEDDPATAQSTVTCVYQAAFGGQWRYVTLLWAKNLMNQSFSITIDSFEGDLLCTCKVDVKPWHFWSKKGTKYIDIDGHKAGVHWDLRSAKFTTSPEPSSDYYLVIVSEEEIVLLLGDNKKKAYKKAKAKPSDVLDAFMLYKKENVFAKKSFSTAAKFNERRRENDIVVERSTSTSGSNDPEMWISIDGIVLVHVRNLQWKFRGNQTVLVHKRPVQVFWDVHDWLFSAFGTGRGLFIFKPSGTEAESDNSSVGGSSDAGSENSSESRYCSSVSYATAREFCLFLYAYKIE